MKRNLIILLIALSLHLLFPEKSRAAEKAPNFIIVFIDDLGYGDLACYGHEQIRTPNLDRMAREGMRFTNFYSCACVCTPSRAGLMTGRYPIRSGLTRVLNPTDQVGIPDSEQTLAEVLKGCGYSTACIGKWHLGHLPQFLPTRHGFDSYLGIPYSNDMFIAERGHPPIPLMRGEAIIEQPANQDTLTKRYTEEAVQFIKANREKPFFLYLPHTMVHVPLHVSDDFRGRSPRGLYGDAVEEVDWSVGQILQTLAETGLDENTLVLFTSDNGPWLTQHENGGSAGILRNGKGTVFEGGVREPFIARWPGQIPAGQINHEPAITLDFLPTLARLANAALPEGLILDGKDISEVLRGKGHRADAEFFFYQDRTLQAHRSGPWKLKRAHAGSPPGRETAHETFLFNLEKDPSETQNLFSANPDVAQRLEREMRDFEEKIAKEL